MSSDTASYQPPIPVELPAPGTKDVARRLVQVGRSATWEIGGLFARRLVGRRRKSDSLARALRRVCEDLGVTYVKFGQFVGSAPDLAGEAVATEFRRCMDTGPALSRGTVRAIIETDLGRQITSVFRNFDLDPLAAASVAVVHRAQLHSGEHVAVKILRPEADRLVATDLALLTAPIRILAAQGYQPALPLLSYLIGLREQIAEELDLRNEARSMSYFRELFAALRLSQIVVPRPFPDLSGRRVLTMELLDGVAIDDLASIEAMGVEPAPLIRELMRAWILTGMRKGVFHADIHAGNLLLLRDGRLALLDWGIVARLDPDTHRLMRSLLEAAVGDEAAWSDISDHIIHVYGSSMRDGLGLSDSQIATLVRAQLEPLFTRPIADVSMSSLLVAPEDTIALATGELPRRSFRERLSLFWRGRKVARAQLREGVLNDPYQRATFLAGKQLVYLERYWRMYLPEAPLLGDVDFIRAVLDGDE